MPTSFTPTPLAGGFPQVSRHDWAVLAAKSLKGASLDSLSRRTADGAVIQPLYAPGDTPPLTAARVRPVQGPPWDVRAQIETTDPGSANAEALDHLAGGATSLLVKAPDGDGVVVAMAGPQDMARMLSGVALELAPVALDAGLRGPEAADWLAAAAKGAPRARLAFHLDPLGALGTERSGRAEHLRRAAETAARHAAVYPQASLFLANGRAAHEAGATDGRELAIMTAAALAYARVLVDQGLSMEEAFGCIVLGVSLGADVFDALAKVRAARLLWDRLTSACGVAVPAKIEARSSRRMLTAADPWRNLLRLSAAAFAGAVGGADALVLDPFDRPLGPSSDQARRQSRNIQLVLMEEAHLGQVADPAAGAGYVDALTLALAESAWTGFQGIEAAGGLAAGLPS